MTRYSILVVALLAALPLSSPAGAAVRGQIIPETTAAQHGLTRPWFTQIRMHRGTSRLQHVVLHKGTLFLQTDRATLHAVDAENGKTLWSEQIGHRGHPSMKPGVNDDLVGVINGSYLYIVNRFNGKIVWKAQTDGAPGAGAALSDLRAYVPMVDGLVASYRLETLQDPMRELMKYQQEELTEEEEEELEAERRDTIQLRQEYIPPLLCRSWGRVFINPVVTIQNEGEEFAAWPTDRGIIFVGRINRREEEFFPIRYRLETGAAIVAPPTYRTPDPNDPTDHGTLYAASRDGFVHAIRANDGEPLWRFSAGEPLVEPPIYVTGRIFATVQLGGLHCLDAGTGSELWWAPNIMQFVAMSKSRAYAVDDLERLVVLNLETGARLDAIPIAGLDLRLANTENDRIYLGTQSGLVQCLHEVELAEPMEHRPPPAPVDAEAAGGEEAAVEAPAGGAGPPGGARGDEENPFGAGAPGAGGDEENPFGAGAPGAGGDEENPFGAGAPGAGGDEENPFGAGAPGAGGNPLE
jgi:outer membrane protein assembly factor BamB